MSFVPVSRPGKPQPVKTADRNPLEQGCLLFFFLLRNALQKANKIDPGSYSEAIRGHMVQCKGGNDQERRDEPFFFFAFDNRRPWCLSGAGIKERPGGGQGAGSLLVGARADRVCALSRVRRPLKWSLVARVLHKAWMWMPNVGKGPGRVASRKKGREKAFLYSPTCSEICSRQRLDEPKSRV